MSSADSIFPLESRSWLWRALATAKATASATSHTTHTIGTPSTSQPDIHVKAATARSHHGRPARNASHTGSSHSTKSPTLRCCATNSDARTPTDSATSAGGRSRTATATAATMTTAVAMNDGVPLPTRPFTVHGTGCSSVSGETRNDTYSRVPPMPITATDATTSAAITPTAVNAVFQ